MRTRRHEHQIGQADGLGIGALQGLVAGREVAAKAGLASGDGRCESHGQGEGVTPSIAEARHRVDGLLHAEPECPGAVGLNPREGLIEHRLPG